MVPLDPSPVVTSPVEPLRCFQKGPDKVDYRSIRAGGVQSPRLYGELVSHDVAQSLGTTESKKNDSQLQRRDDNMVRYPWSRQPEALLPQAAPLYTVCSTVSESNASTPPLVSKLSKRPAATSADFSSAIVPSSIVEKTNNKLAPIDTRYEDGSLLKSTFEQQRSSRVKQEQQEETSNIKPHLVSCGDLSPYVSEATCTWGQDLGLIMGQGVGRLRIHGGPVLTTTGIFPQSMQLRWPSNVSTVVVDFQRLHDQALLLHCTVYVLRLVVHSGERIVEDGKTVRVTNAGDYGQDIDVDLRGMLSFENIRSLNVTITACKGPFCCVQRIYAIGVKT